METASERVFDDSSSMLLWVLSLDCHGQIASCTTLDTRLYVHTNVGPLQKQWQDVQSKPIAIDGPSHSMLKEETTLDHCLLRLIPSRQGATDEALICLSRLVGQVRAARVHPSLFLPVRFTVLSVQHSHVCGPLFLVTGAVSGGRSLRRNLENWSGNFFSVVDVT